MADAGIGKITYDRDDKEMMLNQTSQTTEPFLTVDQLSASFTESGGRLEVLSDISLNLNKGDFTAIIGPSGCGKSTLFNVLAGLMKPDRGGIFLNGQEVPHLMGHTAYMQQKDLLLPWRKTLDNAILGLEIKGMPKAEARSRARELLQVFGLEGFEDAYPAKLSGGMRQRVALMRTILCEKEILLLDEPFGALDAITRKEMQKWLIEVWRRFGSTILFVTHDVEEALLMADRVYVVSTRPATVKMELEVNQPRPRQVTDIGLVKMKAEILDLLEQEIRGPAL